MCVYKAVWIHISKDAHGTVLYFLVYMVYDRDKEKQRDFKNVMSFRDTVVSTGQLYKPLAEKLQVGTLKNFADQSGRQFCKLGFLFIFTRTKHVVLNVKGHRLWNVAFVTISPTHTKFIIACIMH